jgi:hypothetical protein
MNEDENKSLISHPSADLVKDSEIPNLLDKIRPEWQAKDLIIRVKRLIYVDPSSACQRLLNAAIYDLRQKIIVAGFDIAKEVAKQHNLPSIDKEEDIHEYSTFYLIDLSYYMGLLTRPEWRRVKRCYEIRKDLEHEDNEYEAGIEDCIYIFKTCIETILQRDPIQILKVTDVKKLIEQPNPAFPSDTLIEDYNHAPDIRQEDICKFLISMFLSPDNPEIVKQNAYICIFKLKNYTRDSVKLHLVSFIHGKIGRGELDDKLARIAYASGIFPYLRKKIISDFFNKFYQQMEKVGYRWMYYKDHGPLLQYFTEIGGFLYCPEEISLKIMKWMVLAYLGEPGGRTMFGHIRDVFYSDTAAPLIKNLIKTNRDLSRSIIKKIINDREIQEVCNNKHVERRKQEILDLISEV